MSDSTRRNMLQILVGAAFCMPLMSKPALATGSLIAPPASPMRFSRVLLREMVDGNVFSVERVFEVRFEASPDGYLVNGRQVSVKASAPPSLEQFVAIEEDRIETGLFPLTLNSFGMITSHLGVPARTDIVTRAAAEAGRRIARLGIPAQERAQLSELVNAIHQAGSAVLAYFPVDLFAPLGEHKDEQRIALPTGEEGHVSSRFSGQRDEQTGLMCCASREVLTEIASDRRRSTENWLLEPA